jgi:hypothetical protein
MVDTDFAKRYGVTTSNLNKAAQRNREKFPEDFMFCLAKNERESSTFQSGISNKIGWGGRRYSPLVFTESELCRSTSQACGLLCTCVVWPCPTRNCGEKSRAWQRNLTPGFKGSFRRSNRCSRRHSAKAADRVSRADGIPVSLKLIRE